MTKHPEHQTVWDLLNRLNTLLKDKRITRDTVLCYSSDDEGNAYHRVFFVPSPVYFDADSYEIMDESEIARLGWEETAGYIPALCIN